MILLSLNYRSLPKSDCKIRGRSVTFPTKAGVTNMSLSVKTSTKAFSMIKSKALIDK